MKSRLFIPVVILTLRILFAHAEASPEEKRKIKEGYLLERLKTCTQDTALLNINNRLGDLLAYRDNERAITYLKEAERLALKLHDEAGLATASHTLSNIYSEMSDFKNALFYANRTLFIDKKNNKVFNIGADYTQLGNIYNDMSDFSKALGFYIEAVKMHEKNGEADQLAVSYSNIGMVLYYNKQYESAKAYYTKSLECVKKFPDPKNEAMVLHNMGLLYSDVGELKKAELNFRKAIQLAEKHDLFNLKKVVYNAIAGIYYENGKLDSCLYYVNRSKDIYKQVGDSVNMMNLDINIASVYADMGQYNKALELLQLIFPRCKNNPRYLQNYYQGISDIYCSMKDFENAYKYQKLYMHAKDSLFNGRTAEQIAELQTKFETNKKEQENRLLQQENKLKEGEIIKQKSARNYTILIVAILFLFLLWVVVQYRNKQKANALLASQNVEIQEQKLIIEEKNRNVTDSIRYALRIQDALLPKEEQLSRSFSEHFVLYKPKDIVSGDFYWTENAQGQVLLATVDCTGHGVPGAMVSVVGYNALNRAVREFGLTRPAAILDKLNELVEETFEKSSSEMKDGMDISLCAIDVRQKLLRWAGANNGLWICRRGNPELIELKPDKQPIGKFENRKPFTGQELQLQEGDTIYLYTDGFADQFGGPRGKKFKYRQIKELLQSLQEQSLQQQRETLEKALEEWRGSLEQVDDVCILGIKV